MSKKIATPHKSAATKKSHLYDTSAATQRKNIANHLIEYGKITTLEARNLYAVMSPAPRVQELRERGWKIVTERIDATDSLGVKHDRVGQYVLISFPIAGAANE